MNGEAYERTANGCRNPQREPIGVGGRQLRTLCVGCDEVIFAPFRYCERCEEERSAMSQQQVPVPFFKPSFYLVIIGAAAILIGQIVRWVVL